MSKKAANTVYINSAWQQHEELITHLSRFSQNVLLIVAPQGGGKTTLLEHFFAKTTPGLYKKHLSVPAQTSTEAFLKQLITHLELDWQGLAKIKSQLNHLLNELQAKQQTALLFIDDAHFLSNEQLQVVIELVNFEAERHKQLHLVLLGEPSLELRLFSPEFAALSNGKIYTIELESWTEQDIKAMLLSKRIRVDQQNISLIFERSGGLPGQVMHEINAIAPANASKNLSKNFKMSNFHPISLGLLAGLILGGTYLLWNNNNQDEGALVPINAAQVSENWQPKEISPQKSPPPVAFHFDKIDTSDVVENESFEEEKVEQLLKEETPQLQVNEGLSEKIATPPVEVALTTNELSAKEPVVQVTKPKKEKEIQKNTKKVSGSRSHHLLSLDKHHYTLQLLGASKEVTVKQFIQKYALENKAHAIKTIRHGKDWYIVVYGDYPSLKEAKTAAKQLKEFQNANVQPWVREISAVQQDVRQG